MKSGPVPCPCSERDSASKCPRNVGLQSNLEGGSVTCVTPPPPAGSAGLEAPLAAFVAAFGSPSSELPSLVASHAVTLPLLLRIAPPGTPDPTPLLYDDAFRMLAASSALALACNVAVFRLPRPARVAARAGPARD